jgi:hypothetical protein
VRALGSGVEDYTAEATPKAATEDRGCGSPSCESAGESEVPSSLLPDAGGPLGPGDVARSGPQEECGRLVSPRDTVFTGSAKET